MANRERFIRRVEELTHPQYGLTGNNTILLIIEAFREHLQDKSNYELTTDQAERIISILREKA